MARPIVNFVIRSMDSLGQALGAESIDAYIGANPAFRTAISSQGDMCWCALTYFRLREAGVPAIRLSDEVDPACINVVHTIQLKAMPVPQNAFVVCVRADMDRRAWAHYHLVQNAAQLGPQTSCIYLWPQPALIARTEAPSELLRVGFMGQPYNGNLAMHPGELAELLSTRGFEFVAPGSDWHDLSQLDASIGIRSFDAKAYPSKPPSKLINAWIAGVPFIGGADSAYAQVGQPGRDYLVATSRSELLSQLERLRGDPQLRGQMIAAGRKAAERYGDTALVRQWCDVLDGPVAARFAAWQANPAHEHRRLRRLAFLDRFISAFRTHGSKLRNALLNARYD